MTGRVAAAPARAPLAGHRIEDLDRHLLLRILSYLDSPQAVQTCLLSQLWRDLWRDVPRSKASIRMFEIEGGDRDHDVRNPLFKKFVNRLLLLRNPVALDVFHLGYCMSRQDEADFHRS
nr:unnamed protein product [Digitaria exilis]